MNTKLLKMELKNIFRFCEIFILIILNLVNEFNCHPRIGSDYRQDFYVVFGKSLRLDSTYLIQKSVRFECKYFYVNKKLLFYFEKKIK